MTIKHLPKRPVVAGLLLFATILGAFLARRALAGGIPATGAMTYAGTLQDSSGASLTGDRNIEVKLWNMATDGTQLCTTDSHSITLDGGHFSVPLPDACTTAITANSDTWADVLVDGASLGRTKLGAVPFAVEAGHAVSADSAAAATNATHATSADGATNAAAVPWGGVAGVPASIQAIGNGAIQVAAGGQVSVGTGTPHGMFTVADSGQTDPNGLPANNIFLGRVHAPNGWDATGLCAAGTGGPVWCTAVYNNWYWGVQTDAATMTSIMRLDPSGNLTTKGTMTASGGNLDIAEDITAADSEVEAADVVAVSPEGRERVVRTRRPYETSIVGVISTHPGVLLNGEEADLQPGHPRDPSQRALALAGRVPVKVTLEGGPIAPGDLLTSSSTPGHAMKATAPWKGGVIGLALTRFPLDTPGAKKSTGRVVVFLNLQSAPAADLRVVDQLQRENHEIREQLARVMDIDARLRAAEKELALRGARLPKREERVAQLTPKAR